MAKRVSKADLPRKLCPVCGRTFVWRKKWAKDWDAVRYCSERCRRAGAAGLSLSMSGKPDMDAIADQ